MITRLSLALFATAVIALAAGCQDDAKETQQKTDHEIVPLPPVAPNSGPFLGMSHSLLKLLMVSLFRT